MCYYRELWGSNFWLSNLFHGLEAPKPMATWLHWHRHSLPHSPWCCWKRSARGAAAARPSPIANLSRRRSLRCLCWSHPTPWSSPSSPKVPSKHAAIHRPCHNRSSRHWKSRRPARGPSELSRVLGARDRRQAQHCGTPSWRRSRTSLS